MIWPAKNPKATSEFGYQAWRGRVHKGIDLVSRTNNLQILAAHSGTVARTGYQAGGAGFYVVLKKGNIETKYFHLKAASSLKNGQPIKKGQVIGIMGSTGGVTGRHLHWEVWKAGQVYNPRKTLGWLENRKAPKPYVPKYRGALWYDKTHTTKGAHVKLWQAQMRKRGYNLVVDGVYGRESSLAAKRFQRHFKLKTDGVVGRTT